MGLSACGLGAGLVLEYLGLTRTDWTASTSRGLAGRGLDVGG